MTGSTSTTATFRAVSESDVLDRIRLPPPDDCPPLTLLLGPCRSGTTALLRAAAAAGNIAYFQPIKRMIRCALVGDHGVLTVRPGVAPIVIKETFGPFLKTEALFDPLRILVRRGYPQDRISVVVVLRDALAMYRSWSTLHLLNPRFGTVDTDVYVAAWWNAVDCYWRARTAGVASTAFVPDGFDGTTDRKGILAALFDRCGLVFGPEAVDWSAADRSLDESIEREPEPDLFLARGALATVRSSTRYQLLRRDSADVAGIPEEVLRLRDAYEEFRASCLTDLGEISERH